jgi:hypothetical protein
MRVGHAPPPPSTSAFEWDIGLSIGSVTDGDGICSSQVDVPGEQKARSSPAQHHHPYGIYSRPLTPVTDGDGNPNPATANQLLYAMEGGQLHAWPLENPLVLALLPTIQPGETLFHGPLGQFWRMTNDGQMACYCPPPAGNSGSPPFVMNVGPSGFVVAGPWGSLRLDDSGFHITTSSGATFDLGGVSGLPGPLSAVSSSASLTAGNINLVGNTVIGAGALGQAPGVNGTFLLAKLAAMDAALKAIIQLIPTGIAPTSGGPVTYATLALAIAAVAASVPASPVLLYTDSNATY